MPSAYPAKARECFAAPPAPVASAACGTLIRPERMKPSAAVAVIGAPATSSGCEASDGE
jgi:hypothetical protein